VVRFIPGTAENDTKRLMARASSWLDPIAGRGRQNVEVIDVG